jgi:hypothetical protein
MTFTFAESIKTIQALEAKFNAVRYDNPQEGTLRLAYVSALEQELAELHKLCTETREEYTKRTAREVLESLKKR